MSFTVSYAVKRFFFDRQSVVRRMDRATHRNLWDAGRFVRRAARSKLRRRKRISRPGEAPSVHSRDPVATLKNILYAFDGRRSIVIGPVGLNQIVETSGTFARTTVPAVLEFGGTISIREWRFSNLDAMKIWNGWDRFTSSRKFDKRWRRQDRRWRDRAAKRGSHRLAHLGVETRVRAATIAPRPFMGPAWAQERPKFPLLWANSLVA